MKKAQKIISLLCACMMLTSTFASCEVLEGLEGLINPQNSSEASTTTSSSSSYVEPENSSTNDPTDDEKPAPDTPTEKDYSYRPQITEVMPAIRINTADGSNEFATMYDQEDKKQGLIEYVDAEISVDGCEEDYAMEEVEAEVKVRGNFTLNYDKKPLRIKFKKKRNLLGLHEGEKYKNWVLLADWRDLSMSNNSMAFYFGNTILGSDGYYSSDYRHVEVYLNGEYWGVYLLAEQQEAKEGRASVAEVEDDYTGTDIGYFFEYDSYYTQEQEMPNGEGDPTFTVTYYTPGATSFEAFDTNGEGNGEPGTEVVPPTGGDTGTDVVPPTDGGNTENKGTEPDTGGNGGTEVPPADGGNTDQGTDNKNGDEGTGEPGQEGDGGNKVGGNTGPTNGYTVKSDIYSDEQLAFLQNYTEKAYEIAVRAANGEFYKFSDDYSTIVPTQGTMKEVAGAVIDLQSLVDMYILHELCCDPDIAWSSFYMSLDMSAGGNKKITFEAPWDFDAALGMGTLTDGQGMYAAESKNPWLILFIEQDWFQDMVKEKWQEMKDGGVLTTALELVMEQKETYEAYFAKNYERWEQRITDANIDFDQKDELKNATTQGEAADILYEWLETRFAYLDSQWKLD